MKIRLATEEDLDAIAAIWWDDMLQEHLKLGSDEYTPKPENIARAAKQEYFRDWLGGGEKFMLVAEDNGVVGYSAAKINADPAFVIDKIGYVKNIAVKKERRKQGIGKSLLDETIRALRKRGAKAITLSLDPKNTTAKKFYEENGFYDYQITMRLK